MAGWLMNSVVFAAFLSVVISQGTDFPDTNLVTAIQTFPPFEPEDTPAPETTAAPTTPERTTPEPTTPEPTTPEPTTPEPTTPEPTTPEPTTPEPTTPRPTTPRPTTPKPTTPEPTTPEPTTPRPETHRPTTQEPTVPTTIFTLPAGCDTAKADIQFVLDASGSIGAANYQKQLDWVKTFADQFTIGPDNVQVGVTTFSDYVNNEFWLNTHADKPSLMAAVDQIGYAAATTHTELGLKFVSKFAFTYAHGDRPGVSNIVIVVTDGKSVNPAATQYEADHLHKLNVNVMSIGVGAGVDKAELGHIASDPSNVYTVSDFDALKNIQAQIQTATCEEALTSKCSAPIDLAFLVDKSASISESQFATEEDFVEQMIHQFHISPSEVQVSLALFANYVRHKWCFDAYTTQDTLIQAVKNISCPDCHRGQTATGHALKWAHDYMLTSKCAARPNVPKVVVVLTDGQSTEKPPSYILQQARQLKATGATVITVGVGNVDPVELGQIATAPQFVFTADDFSKLLPLLDDVASVACQAPEAIG